MLKFAITPLDPIAAVVGLGTHQFPMDAPVKVHVSQSTVIAGHDVKNGGH